MIRALLSIPRGLAREVMIAFCCNLGRHRWGEWYRHPTERGEIRVCRRWCGTKERRVFLDPQPPSSDHERGMQAFNLAGYPLQARFRGQRHRGIEGL